MMLIRKNTFFHNIHIWIFMKLVRFSMHMQGLANHLFTHIRLLWQFAIWNYNLFLRPFSKNCSPLFYFFLFLTFQLIILTWNFFISGIYLLDFKNFIIRWFSLPLLLFLQQLLRGYKNQSHCTAHTLNTGFRYSF